jgi:hypothetical protein
MTNTKTTKNSQKVQTLVRQANYELYFSRALPGRKDKPTLLDVTGFNPVTGALSKVRLDGRAVAQLRKILAA